MGIDGAKVVSHVHLLNPSMVSEYPIAQRVPRVNLDRLVFRIEFLDSQALASKTMTLRQHNVIKVEENATQHPALRKAEDLKCLPGGGVKINIHGYKSQGPTLSLNKLRHRVMHIADYQLG